MQGASRLRSLGAIIVEAFAKQLDARVQVLGNLGGTTVPIVHGTSDRAWTAHTIVMDYSFIGGMAINK